MFLVVSFSISEFLLLIICVEKIYILYFGLQL